MSRGMHRNIKIINAILWNMPCYLLHLESHYLQPFTSRLYCSIINSINIIFVIATKMKIFRDHNYGDGKRKGDGEEKYYILLLM